ncbi:MAG: hypothetical protein K0R36_1372 [Chryseobacterium sp.]|jgi:hypothetical protein|nr:hypothetical protein [Chryseobacterium sp.]
MILFFNNKTKADLFFVKAVMNVIAVVQCKSFKKKTKSLLKKRRLKTQMMKKNYTIKNGIRVQI